MNSGTSHLPYAVRNHLEDQSQRDARGDEVRVSRDQAVTTYMDTLPTALYVRTNSLLKESL